MSVPMTLTTLKGGTSVGGRK